MACASGARSPWARPMRARAPPVRMRASSPTTPRRWLRSAPMIPRSSLVGLFPSSSATYTTATTSASTPTGGLTTPDGIIKNAFVPNLAARMRLSPDWAVGLAVYAPWGLSTDYEDGWAGRYHALKSDLLTVDIMPTVSYQISDSFAVAAGLQIQYAKGSSRTPSTSERSARSFASPARCRALRTEARCSTPMAGASDSRWARWPSLPKASLSVCPIAPPSRTRWTARSTSRSTRQASAPRSRAQPGLFLDTDAETAMTTPDRISVGARVRLSEQWTALGELDWTNWSRFRELRVVPDNPLQPDDVTDRAVGRFAVRLGRPRIPARRSLDLARRRGHRRRARYRTRRAIRAFPMPTAPGCRSASPCRRPNCSASRRAMPISSCPTSRSLSTSVSPATRCAANLAGSGEAGAELLRPAAELPHQLTQL